MAPSSSRTRLKVFQSSPAPKGGRYTALVRQPRTVTLFQSSPAPKGGRYLVLFGVYRYGKNVSILARPEGRALHNRRVLYAAGATSFNPRPPRRAGATPLAAALASTLRVFQSSPAPKGGRYWKTAQCSLLEDLVSILARPEGRALRDTWTAKERYTLCFNPRPPRRAGATPCVRLLIFWRISFNPRPPRRAGATTSRVALARLIFCVSILARPEGRALPQPIERQTSMSCVSILARPEGRALRMMAPAPIHLGYVSILARPEGRALHTIIVCSVVFPRVSILARPEGRALPKHE